MSNRKILVITYYWPPCGGVAVQRTLKFVKYLQNYGWTPIVYTVSNGEYPIRDYLLENQVPKDVIIIKRPIFEPYSIYNFIKRKSNKVSTRRNGLILSRLRDIINKIFYFIRGNLFIPDPRCFWIRPSSKFLADYLKKNPVDVIFSTGPPHSTHLIALKLSKTLKLPWVADFRDPWTQIFYYKELRLLGFVDKKYHKLEKSVLQSANLIIVTSPNLKSAFEMKVTNQIKIISNGYDEEDFKSDNAISLDSEFTVTYAGSLFQKSNPIALWQAIASLKSSKHPAGTDIKIRLVGKIDDSVIKSVTAFGLSDNLELIGHVPHHEAIQFITSSQILLISIPNCENSKLWIPAKLYEYMVTKRPIIYIGPVDSDCAQVIIKSKLGMVFDYPDSLSIETYIKQLHRKFISGNLQPNSNSTEHYTRKHLTKQLASALDSLVT